MTRGLVIGKFYPPHRGHKLLINSALAAVDHLDVLVCERAEQKIAGTVRAAWLKELHPRAAVSVIPHLGPGYDAPAWATHTRGKLGERPDLVFTSSRHGEALAGELGARHVAVDPGRQRVPISSAAVREDPMLYWEYLEPPVRAHFCRRICLVGAESSGTTTIAQRLAEHYRTIWVPEYGRDYTALRKQKEGVRLAWESAEFVHIAEQQQINEDAAARRANRVLFCDTDALATCIWHERYMGAWSREVEAIANRRGYDLYILTSADIPFVPDGVRDGELLRGWMTERFRVELTRREFQWIFVEGDLEERLQAAMASVDRVLQTRPRL